MQEDLLSPQLPEQDPLAPEPAYLVEAERPSIPLNPEEQALILAQASDDTKDLSFAVKRNTAALNEGRVAEVREPIVSQEYQSYAKAMRDIAEIGAVRGRSDEVVRAMTKALEMEKYLATSPKLTPTTENTIVASTALTKGVELESVLKEVPFEVVDKTIAEHSENVGLRSTILGILDREGASPITDIAAYVGNNFLPFVWATYEKKFFDAASRATGQDIPYSTNPMGWINAIHNTWAQLDKDGKAALLKKLQEDTYGVFGGNKTAQKIFFEMLSSYSSSDAMLHSRLTGLGLFADVVTGLGGVMALSARAGVLAKAMAETAGRRTAGTRLADTLVTDTNATLGLNDAEAVSRAIAAGKHPYSTVDPSVFEGASPHMQARLKEHWDKMIASEMERLTADGIPQAERDAKLAQIKASYVTAQRKDIYAVKFPGAPEGDSVKLTVMLTDEEGNFFRTEEAARAGARRRGLADDAYTITTKEAEEALEAMGTRANIRAWHGGDTFDTFRQQFIGKGQGGQALGHGFSAALTKSMAEWFARGRATQGKTPSVYELSLPDVKHFLKWDESFTKQSKEVKEALGRVLTADELKLLKSADGSDVYMTLAARLGSNRAASEALHRAGVVGNVGTEGDIGREFLVFSEEVMNKALRKRELFTGDAETAAARTTRRADEFKQDREAAEFLESFGYGDGDAVRASLGAQKTFLSFTDKGLQRLRSDRVFDNPSVGLFDRNVAPNQFSSSFNEQQVEFYSGMLKLLGLEKERALFVTMDDLPTLINRPEFQQEFIQDALREFNQIVSRQSGAWLPIPISGGKRLHLIGIGKHPTLLDSLRTGIHEIGHMFDHAYLKNMLGDKRDRLLKGFQKWIVEKGGDPTALAARVYSPDLKALDAYQLLAKLDKEYATMPLADVQRAIGAKNWLSTFEEYVAEQMTKWGTTDRRALDVGERVWADWRDQIYEFYKKAILAMHKMFGKQVMSVEPEDAFKQLMDLHLTRVQSMRDQGLIGKMAANSLDFTETEVRANARTAAGPVGPGGGLRKEPTKGGPAGPAPRSNYLLKVKVDDPIRSDGTYDATDIDSMPWIVADPRHGVSVDAMMGRVIGVHQTAKTRRDMTEMLKPALSPLSRKERERVLAVLEEGDQASHAGGYGKEFSASELLARNFTDKEMEAYFTVRQSRMLNFFVHEKAMVDSMRRKGLMEIEVFGQGKMVGKALSIEAAEALGKKTVYDVTRKEYVELSAKTAYGEGKRLIELGKGSKVDGQEVSFILATEKEATARQVYKALHYRPGEFARIYSDNYFIRMGVGRVVDGVKQAVEMPIRTAATEKEAKEFIEAVTKGRDMVNAGASDAELERTISKFYSNEEFKQAVINGELKDMTSLRFHFTREIDDYLGQTLESHAHTGKLFTRDRGEHIGTADRTRAARSNILNPYESLSAEITMVSHFASVNAWKEAQIDRWMNSFGDMLGQSRTGDNVRDFYAAAGARFSHVTGKKGLFAERTHAYIMRQVGIQTQEHKWWQSLMRRVGEGVMPYVGEGVGAVIRDANPLNFIRSVNHHLTLGLFNFSQLIVQANGMSVAAAIHPIHGLKSASMFPAVRLALMSDNPEVWARISKVVGEDVGKLAKAIRQSGIIDNLRSTSLHNIEDGKLDIFASMPKRALSTAIDKGAFFFNRGEEAARIIAFDIARREWEKLNPGKDFLSKGGLQWIVSKADDYTMNMTRANLARWQEGVMSIPTQFLQYNIKLLQNIASGLVSGGGKGRGFTRSEALKALAGSIAFYGAAGMGISNMMGEWIPDEMEEKMPPEMKTAIGQGVLAAGLKAVVEATTGDRFDVALGARLGSINFFTDLVYDAYNDPKNIWEAMLGPSRSTGERLAVVADIANLWRRQPVVTLDDVGKGALEFFSQQVSSARHATKAYYTAQGNNVLKNRKGESVAELSTPEVWAMALGLSPSVAYDAYQIIDSRRAHFRALDGIAEMVFSTHKRILDARLRGDEDAAVRMEAALQLMYPQNMGDFLHVQKQVREKLAPYDTQFQKLMIDHAMKGGNFNKPFATTNPTPMR